MVQTAINHILSQTIKIKSVLNSMRINEMYLLWANRIHGEYNIIFNYCKPLHTISMTKKSNNISLPLVQINICTGINLSAKLSNCENESRCLRVCHHLFGIDTVYKCHAVPACVRHGWSYNAIWYRQLYRQGTVSYNKICISING